MMNSELNRHSLDDHHSIYSGRVPDHLQLSASQFEEIWSMHPVEHHLVQNRVGRWVSIPRWQAAYGASYRFAGNVVEADPIPFVLRPYLEWARQTIDAKMNGLFLNWYDGPSHYIGPHNDADHDLIKGSPIITISCGETRKFRMRPNSGKGFIDFPAAAGTFFVIPFDTNQAWSHEVPKSKKESGPAYINHRTRIQAWGAFGIAGL